MFFDSYHNRFYYLYMCFRVWRVQTPFFLIIYQLFVEQKTGERRVSVLLLVQCNVFMFPVTKKPCNEYRLFRFW